VFERVELASIAEAKTLVKEVNGKISDVDKLHREMMGELNTLDNIIRNIKSIAVEFDDVSDLKRQLKSVMSNLVKESKKLGFGDEVKSLTEYKAMQKAIENLQNLEFDTKELRKRANSLKFVS
jgi:hypothetical protein